MENRENVGAPMSPKEKIENFWYHYKWHTIVGAVVVITLCIVVLQMCKKPDYDAYIMYAGDYKISNMSEDGDLPHYQRVLASLKKVVDDENGDGKIDVNLQNLYAFTDEQLGSLGSDSTAELSLAITDSETLESALVVGNYYVCFLSEELFLANDAIYDGAMFEPLAKYATSEDIDYEYASERGIYLRSLPYAEFIELPGDTVVCLRSLNGYSSAIGGRANKQNFAIGERVIKNILSYK
ncbi:MAG: hypothetical protein IJW03_02390 [Clostridia bacterium]|nr:hypothetical protein [Clostridia bacterium]